MRGDAEGRCVESEGQRFCRVASRSMGGLLHSVTSRRRLLHWHALEAQGKLIVIPSLKCLKGEIGSALLTQEDIPVTAGTSHKLPAGERKGGRR